MHWALKIVTIAATTLVATIVTVISVTIAALFAVSSSLPGATDPNFGYPRKLQALAEPVNFGMLTAVPHRFPANSYELDTAMQRVGVNLLADAAVEFSGNMPALNVVATPASVKTPVATSAPLAVLPIRHPAQVSTSTAAPPSLAALHAPQSQLQANVERISFDTPSLAPMAFVRFCMRYPQDCKIRGLAFRPDLVPVTEIGMAELVKVNRDVNRAIFPHENTRNVSAEEWLVSPREGDCKDYAVTKRHELLALGWPSSSLFLAEAIVASGEHHLVLIVRTRENDLVLDNLSESLRPVSQVPYQWVRAQQTKNPKLWETITVTRVTRMAMNAP